MDSLRTFAAILSHKAMKSTTFKGIAYGVIAAACYGLNPLFTLPLYHAGIGSDSVLFYRYGFATLFLGLLMLFRKESFSISRKEFLPLFMLGVIFALSSLTLFLSYNFMDAGIASTILFIYPLLVALIMAIFFKEKITLLTLTSITLAFVGISMLYKGDGGTTLSSMGVLLVFLSSLTYAIYIVAVNRSILKHISPNRLTFYALLFGWLVFFVRLDFGVGLQLIREPLLWVNPIGLAFFPTIISLVAMTRSIHYIGSTPAAILGALEPITALLIGVWVFDERLTLKIVIGIMFILVGVILIVSGKELMHRLAVRLHWHHR